MTKEDRDLADWTLEILAECCLYQEGDSLDDRELAAILKIGKAIEAFQDMRDAKGIGFNDDDDEVEIRMPREK